MPDAPTKILIVDDNAQDAELVADALRKRFPEVEALMARDGAEAMEMIDGFKGSAPPRVVLLDLKMPKVDGFEVLRHLKGDAETCSIPVVVLTSSALESDVLRAYGLGANSYVVKPMEFESLTDVLGCVGEYWLSVDRGPQDTSV